MCLEVLEHADQARSGRGVAVDKHREERIVGQPPAPIRVAGLHRDGARAAAAEWCQSSV